MLESVAEVREKIVRGGRLLLAGDESLLSQLPTGNWIGGTIPYFMDAEGGVFCQARIFVNEIPECATAVDIREYSVETLPRICSDVPENGYSFVILPAGSPAHVTYAQSFPKFAGAFLKPIVGWVSGVQLDEVGRRMPRVFNGRAGTSSAEHAVAMRVTLPAGKMAEIDIVNIFAPGSGAVITFPFSGFSATECTVNGRREKLARYMAESAVDRRFPLTADYNGTIVNVSVESVEPGSGAVNFYAPVFAGVEYRFARPPENYIRAFNAALPTNGAAPAFACNCILNYLYASLEGKHTGAITGPMTFGEIAYQLLNQTLVRLIIHDV